MNYFNPLDWLKLFYRVRLLHFLLVGGTGVLLNLLMTWFFTEFFFGLEGYFYGYLIGLSVNIVYNFLLHTHVTYKTKKEHMKRFRWFVAYTLVFTFIQALLVRWLTPLIGLEYYLFVIATIIAIGSIITFLIFKLWLFKEK